MNTPRHSVPSLWSEGLFLKKVFAAAMLIVVTLALGGSHLDTSNVIPRILFFSPFIGAGFFVLVRTVQVRPFEESISYRKWFRWHEVAPNEIESIQSLLFGFAGVKLRNKPQRLLFFPDEDNNHLLGFDASKEAIESRRRTFSQIEPANPLIETMLAVAGFTVAFLSSHLLPALMPHLPPALVSHDPGWVRFLGDFESQHQSLLCTILAVMLIWRLKENETAKRERRLDAFFLGFMIAGYFVPAQVENLDRFFR